MFAVCRLFLFLVIALAAALGPQCGSALAQTTDGSRRHTAYAVELEPHLVYQWAEEPFWDDDGFGVGLRASIPLINHGPIQTIDNNLAISFGLDWAFFEGCAPYANDCDAMDFWLPVTAQWNFFITRRISLFPEIGLAIQHSRLDWDGPIPGNCRRYRGVDICSDDATDTDIEFVLWLGARFGISDNLALTLRLGTPSLLFGVSMFL